MFSNVGLSFNVITHDESALKVYSQIQLAPLRYGVNRSEESVTVNDALEVFGERSSGRGGGGAGASRQAGGYHSEQPLEP